jgi:hypothetical protein
MLQWLTWQARPPVVTHSGLACVLGRHDTQHPHSRSLCLTTLCFPTLCHRKERLVRLRRHMHEVLLDQLPLLRDLQRVLDEAALNVGPPPEAAKAGRLILEQVGGEALAARAELVLPCLWLARVTAAQLACSSEGCAAGGLVRHASYLCAVTWEAVAGSILRTHHALEMQVELTGCTDTTAWMHAARRCLSCAMPSCAGATGPRWQRCSARRILAPPPASWPRSACSPSSRPLTSWRRWSRR